MVARTTGLYGGLLSAAGFAAATGAERVPAVSAISAMGGKRALRRALKSAATFDVGAVAERGHVKFSSSPRPAKHLKYLTSPR